MAFKTLLFLLVAILLATTLMVSAREFEDEKFKKPKALTLRDLRMQTPPLQVNEVYDDEKVVGKAIGALFKPLVKAGGTAGKTAGGKAGKAAGGKQKGGGGWFGDVLENIFGSYDSDDSPSPEASLHN